MLFTDNKRCWKGVHDKDALFTDNKHCWKYIVRMSSLQTMNVLEGSTLSRCFVHNKPCWKGVHYKDVLFTDNKHCWKGVHCQDVIFTDDESYLRAVAYSELFVVVLLLFCVVQVDGMSKYATAGGSGEGLGACTI